MQVGSTQLRIIMSVKQHLYINIQTERTLFQNNARLLTHATQLEDGDLSVFRVSQFSSCLHGTRTTEGPFDYKTQLTHTLLSIVKPGTCKPLARSDHARLVK